jgi:hypothetical protein
MQVRMAAYEVLEIAKLSGIVLHGTPVVLYIQMKPNVLLSPRDHDSPPRYLRFRSADNLYSGSVFHFLFLRIRFGAVSK